MTASLRKLPLYITPTNSGFVPVLTFYLSVQLAFLSTCYHANHSYHKWLNFKKKTAWRNRQISTLISGNYHCVTHATYLIPKVNKYLPRIENRIQAIFMCVMPQTESSRMPASHGSRRDLAILAPPPNWWVPSPANWVPSFSLPPLRDEQSRCFRVLITVAIGLAEVILVIYRVVQKDKHKGEDKDVNINIDTARYLIQSVTL